MGIGGAGAPHIFVGLPRPAAMPVSNDLCGDFSSIATSCSRSRDPAPDPAVNSAAGWCASAAGRFERFRSGELPRLGGVPGAQFGYFRLAENTRARHLALMSKQEPPVTISFSLEA
jgi:hypothetical protein